MPYMDHIWKVTGCIKTKYGFHSKPELLPSLSMVLMWNINFKISVMWEYMLTDSPYNSHIIPHFKITLTNSPYNNHIMSYSG